LLCGTRPCLTLLHTPVTVQTPGLAMKQKTFKMYISRGEI